jgi:2'-5' RNA ligase
VQDTITALQHGHSGVTTYPLSHPLEGWHAAITSGGHQVVHRVDPDTKTLHVGYAGHNTAEAEARLGSSSEGGSLPVEFHKGAEKDFDSLHPEVQEKALNTIDRLARGEQHKYDHALNGKPGADGWRSARADFLHRVTHRFEDNEGNPTSYEKAHRLFIGHIGPHNYEAAEKRLSSLTDFFREAALQQTASVEEEDYRMQHRAPGPQHAPLHNPTQPNADGGAFQQEDLDHPEWGGIGEPHEESLQAVRRAKGNPDAPVTIYRSVPHGIYHIRTGDWVTTSAQYAHEHGMHPDDPSKDWPVLKATVPAKHVHTDGNDINEWGYNGPTIEHAAVHGSDEAHHTAARQPYSEDLSDDRPVTFDYHRRTTPAPRNTVHYHGQDIEPHGRYVSQGKSYADLPDLESGTLTFQRPLRLHSPTDDPSHPDHWKQQLVRRYDGKTGAELSQAIRDDGYDGIMTHDAYGPSETVDLTHLSPRTAAHLTSSEEQLVQRQAAAVAHDDGVMVAFVPPPEIAAQLAQDGGQTADDLHITLAYLGNVGDYTAQQLTLLPQLVSAWAMRQKPVTIRIGGVGKFNNAFKDQHVLWAHPDIPGGVQMHVSLARELEQYGFRLPSEHGWTAHMTLRYVNEHFRFMPHLPEIGWEATEVVTFIGPARHAARLGLRPSTPTTL